MPARVRSRLNAVCVALDCTFLGFASGGMTIPSSGHRLPGTPLAWSLYEYAGSYSNPRRRVETNVPIHSGAAMSDLERDLIATRPACLAQTFTFRFLNFPRETIRGKKSYQKRNSGGSQQPEKSIGMHRNPMWTYICWKYICIHVCMYMHACMHARN